MPSDTNSNPISIRWRRPNGYKQVLLIAFPLILSTGSWSIQQFVDRMFLSWYSAESLAAAMPAGILSFTVICFFLGTSSYVSTFIAQYIGAGRPHRVGPAMWQGIYYSLIGGVIVTCTIFLGDPLFNLVGHDPEVKKLEILYWKYMMAGGFFPIGLAAVSSFFSGRGQTYPVMWASITATCLNIFLNYLLIFGNMGFPEMGIAGAGLSTIISQFFNFILLLTMAFSGENNRRYHTISGWRFETVLFRRLIKFGLPIGVQFFLDIAAFSAFVLIIGRLGAAELAATNIAFNVSMLAFMPMIGMGIAVSVLVGQALGSDKPDMADRATFSALQMSLIYMGTITIFYLVLPGMFIYPFAANADPSEFQEIQVHAMTAMKFVAAWSIFDSAGIVISAALKGAGDTKFIMMSIVGLSLGILILPTYITLEVFDFGLNGTRPTHPQLLDWLAAELVDHDWSMKHLHRIIVTSAAYRMSSSVAGGAANAAIDPDNRYWWRRQPIRIESQVVRDSLLALAGTLDSTLGGPPVLPADQATSTRRSLYFFHSNNSRNRFLRMFDEAMVKDCYRREQSVVPQQALALTNSRLVLDAAPKIAQQLSDGTTDDDTAFIRRAFAVLLGMTDIESEITASQQALDEWRKLPDSSPENVRTNFVWALINHNDFVTVR